MAAFIYPAENFDFGKQFPKSKITKGLKVTDKESEFLKNLRYSFEQFYKRPFTDSEILRNALHFAVVNQVDYLNEIPFLIAPPEEQPEESAEEQSAPAIISEGEE